MEFVPSETTLRLCTQQAEDGSEEFGGAKPFSEPETRIVRLLAENSRPQVSTINQGHPSHALHQTPLILHRPGDGVRHWMSALSPCKEARELFCGLAAQLPPAFHHRLPVAFLLVTHAS